MQGLQKDARRGCIPSRLNNPNNSGLKSEWVLSPQNLSPQNLSPQNLSPQNGIRTYPEFTRANLHEYSVKYKK
jgi:hypothetical protein